MYNERAEKNTLYISIMLCELKILKPLNICSILDILQIMHLLVSDTTGIAKLLNVLDASLYGLQLLQ